MSQQNPSPKPREDFGWKNVLRRLGLALKKNWGFKLLALLIAIVLWAGLISQDPNLTREKAFSDVTISVTGADTLKRNGLIVVSDLSSVLSGAHLRVDVPQMQYQAATASTYNPRIDLSRIRETGVQTVKVSTTNSSTYGTVEEIVPDSVEIEVEEYVTRYRIPVTLYTIGSAPAGYYATTPNLDPPLVAVSGPKSLVDQIVRAEATLDLSQLPAREGTMRTTVPFTLVDAEGNAVESSLLEVTSESVLLDTVVVEQEIYAMRTMDLSDVGLVTGEPEEGYEIKSITITPSTIVAAGRAANLEVLDTLYPEGQVDVGGLNESFTQQLKVRKPSELVYLSSDTVTVAVDIGPVIVSRTMENLPVSITGVGKGLTSSMSTTQASVVITGPQLFVNALRSGNITLTCDASGLTAGTYDLPILCQLSAGEGESYTLDVQPLAAQVTLIQK